MSNSGESKVKIQTVNPLEMLACFCMMLNADGILNSWEGYAFEKLPHSDADISLMINHIRTLLKTEELFDLCILRLQNMFQYPSGPSKIII